MHRNERKLYRGKCYGTGKDIVATTHVSAGFKTYSNQIYLSDDRDPSATGTDFDFSKTLTENMLGLKKDAPMQALDSSRLENSDYTEHASRLKNCYMCFAAVV